jgi:hypothetical protein
MTTLYFIYAFFLYFSDSPRIKQSNNIKEYLSCA